MNNMKKKNPEHSIVSGGFFCVKTGSNEKMCYTHKKCRVCIDFLCVSDKILTNKATCKSKLLG